MGNSLNELEDFNEDSLGEFGDWTLSSTSNDDYATVDDSTSLEPNSMFTYICHSSSFFYFTMIEANDSQ